MNACEQQQRLHEESAMSLTNANEEAEHCRAKREHSLVAGPRTLHRDIN
jgi:hypothetical protein